MSEGGREKEREKKGRVKERGRGKKECVKERERDRERGKKKSIHERGYGFVSTHYTGSVGNRRTLVNRFLGELPALTFPLPLSHSSPKSPNWILLISS